jgi:hypothetical protein
MLTYVTALCFVDNYIRVSGRSVDIRVVRSRTQTTELVFFSVLLAEYIGISVSNI